MSTDLKLEFYFVSPLEVVKVTKQNMEQVAEWCGGRVATVESRRNPGKIDTYVWVPTPKGTQISWAFPGMFITKRMVVNEKNELKTTYSVFRRDYFERNYFATPGIAVDLTWERAARENKKGPAKKEARVVLGDGTLSDTVVEVENFTAALVPAEDKERETPSSPLTEPREAEKHEEEAEREAMEASGEPTAEEIEAERQSLIEAKIAMELVESGDTSKPAEIDEVLFVPPTLVEEQKVSAIPNHLK